MAIQTSHASALLNHIMIDDAAHIELPLDVNNDLRTYLTSLTANLQPYLREGKSLNGIGARLVNGGALFLILFSSENQEQQIAVDREVWALEDAAAACAEHLRGADLASGLRSFIADVLSKNGELPVVLIADNGLMFFRPGYNGDLSTYDISAVDALNIAKAAA